MPLQNSDVDLDSKANRQFVSEFVNSTNSNGLLDTEGRPTPELKARINRALLGCVLMRKGAIKDARSVLTNIIEAMGQDELGLKKPINGIMATVGRLLKLGRIKEQYDLTPDLAQAVSKLLDYKKARANGEVKTIEQEKIVQELNLGKEFKRDDLTQVARVLFEHLADTKSAKKTADILNAYAEIAEKIDTTTPDMLGGKPMPKGEVLDKAIRQIEAEEEARKKAKQGDEQEEFKLSENSSGNGVKHSTKKTASQVSLDTLRKKFMGTKMWMKAPNGKSSKLSEDAWLTIRTDNFKKYFGDWELAALHKNAQKAWNDPQYKFTFNFSPSEKLKDRLEDLLGHEVSSLQIAGDTVQHIKNDHSLGEEKRGQKNIEAADIACIPYLLNNFDNAELSPLHNDKKGNQAVEIRKRINGVSVIGTIEKGKAGVHVVTAWQFVKTSDAPMTNTPEPNVQDDSDIRKIQHDLEKIKGSYNNFSKVVDENGEPLVVYHGTRRPRFFTFAPNKGMNINGVYHASNLGVASHWSGTSSVTRLDEELADKLDSIESEKDLVRFAEKEFGLKIELKTPYKITEKDLKEFRLSRDHLGTYYPYSIYFPNGTSTSFSGSRSSQARFDGIKERIEWFVKDNLKGKGANYANYLSIKNPLVVDAKGSSYHNIQYNGKRMNTESIAEIAKKDGYDGVIIKNVLETDYEDQITDDYIVFKPEQIKSATDNIGTFDPNNPDIRYSKKTADDNTPDIFAWAEENNQDNEDRVNPVVKGNLTTDQPEQTATGNGRKRLSRTERAVQSANSLTEFGMRARKLMTGHFFKSAVREYAVKRILWNVFRLLRKESFVV